MDGIKLFRDYLIDLAESANIQLIFNTVSLHYAVFGEVAERSNAAVLKTVEGLSPPRVRIPASPPKDDLTKSIKPASCKG